MPDFRPTRHQCLNVTVTSDDLKQAARGRAAAHLPEKIGVVLGEVVAIGVWLMMFWVVYHAM